MLVVTLGRSFSTYCAVPFMEARVHTNSVCNASPPSREQERIET